MTSKTQHIVCIKVIMYANLEKIIINFATDNILV